LDSREFGALRFGIHTLVNDSSLAYQRYLGDLDAVLAGKDAPKCQTHIAHVPNHGQQLLLFCGVELSIIRHLGQRVADVVHPLRVARDRIEKNKRALELPADVWPIRSPLWSSIEKIDNVAKHEESPELHFVPEQVVVQVYDSSRTTFLTNLPAELLPERVESDARLYKIVDRIPKRWTGPTFAYAAGCVFSFRFGSKLGISSGKEVTSTLDEFQAAGTGLLSVLEKG